MALYRIERVEDATYLDGGGKVRQGYAVTFVIIELDESHTINVETSNPQAIDQRIREEIKRRVEIGKLGA